MPREADIPGAPHREVALNAWRALVDTAQNRLGTFEVITPGHPFVPPRDAKVGQRAEKVMNSCWLSGTHAADDDVKRRAREPVLISAVAQE